MAEENPHIEIKSPVKPISSSREQYLFENENLILGNAGFIFRIYPTLKERLAKILEEQKLNSRIAKSKSMAQMFPKIKYSGSLNQPILRFKNRTGLERILEIVQQHCKPEEEESIKKIRERHVKSIDSTMGMIYKGGFKDYKKKLKGQKYNLMDRNKMSTPEQFFNQSNRNLNGTKNKIFLTRLQMLNAEAKKIKRNYYFKTHFKAVESVYLNPKPMYDVLKKEEKTTNKVISYSYNENLEKKNIEKMNEYKNDIHDLIVEEQEKQKFINSKEFLNYLNNKEYYSTKAIMDYKNKSLKDTNKNNNKINYLRKLAFGDKNIYPNHESGNINTDNTSNEDNDKKEVKMNYDEKQLRIGKKVFRIKNQMDQIAKEILNKCKFYTNKIKK